MVMARNITTDMITYGFTKPPLTLIYWLFSSIFLKNDSSSAYFSYSTFFSSFLLSVTGGLEFEV